VTSIVVITAGLSQPSATRLLADWLARAISGALDGSSTELSVEIVELREYARDLANNVVAGFPSPRLAAVIDRVSSADGLVAVTPIYTGSYSGLFKMFVDVLDPDALAGKPVLIAATAGSARHALALEHAMRPLFSYLRTVVVPTAVFAATEDWAVGRDLGDRIERAAEELARLLRPAAERPIDETARQRDSEVISFERLLAGQPASSRI
jgi:FMN reductase